MPPISIALFVEVLAVLTTGYLITVACLFLGYFGALDFQFIGLFSILDFTSQAAILFPFVTAMLITVAGAGEAAERLARHYKVPFKEAVQFVLIGAVLLGAFAEQLGIGHAFPVEYQLATFLLLVAVFGGGTLYDMRKELATEPVPWASVVFSIAIVTTLSAAGLGFIGAYWAHADTAGEDTVAFEPQGKPCFEAVLLKSSSAGVLILNRSRVAVNSLTEAERERGWNGRLEFHSFDALGSIKHGACDA
jgi:hypothetical protein